MNKIFVTSDHHFGHTNIIKYENRPFNTLDVMNEEMIRLWNETVNKNDTVYHLGDFCFNGKPSELLRRLNGRVILVMGNHDFKKSKKLKFWYNQGFYKVYDHPIIIDNYKYEQGNKIHNYIILSHEPLTQIDFSTVNIHGHLHRSGVMPNIQEDKHINVCVELTNYRPKLLNQLLEEYYETKRNIETNN